MWVPAVKSLGGFSPDRLLPRDLRIATWRLVEGGGRKGPRLLLFVPASKASHLMSCALRSATTSLEGATPSRKPVLREGTLPRAGRAPPDRTLFSHLMSSSISTTPSIRLPPGSPPSPESATAPPEACAPTPRSPPDASEI